MCVCVILGWRRRPARLSASPVSPAPTLWSRSSWSPSSTHERRRGSVLRRRATREEDQIVVRVAHDECARAPWLGPQRLLEPHSGGLILQEQRLCVAEGYRCGQQ